MEQAVQRSFGASIPGSVHGKAGWSSEQSGPMGGPKDQRIMFLPTVGGGTEWPWRTLDSVRPCMVNILRTTLMSETVTPAFFWVWVANELKDMFFDIFPLDFPMLFTQNWTENNFHSVGEGWKKQQSKVISKHFIFNQIESHGNHMQSLIRNGNVA